MHEFDGIPLLAGWLVYATTFSGSFVTDLSFIVVTVRHLNCTEREKIEAASIHVNRFSLIVFAFFVLLAN